MSAGELAELSAFCLELPKIELHVHLEGSIRPRTLLELAKRRQVDLPAADEAGLAEWFRFRDFDHFVEIYLTCSRCLRDPEDFQLVVRDFLEEQARQNVRYCEVHFTIGTHVDNGVNADEVADAMWETIREGERRLGCSMRLIPDIVRNLGPRPAEVPLEWALENRERGVIALGISGSEAFASEPFREHFDVARAEGLHRVAHAGEQAGPQSIREALDVCSPERLGHGISAVEDADLVESLAEARLPVEVCPSSNVALGVVDSLDDHPFDALYRAGVAVSVNSDDPPFFDTTLSQEYERLASTFGYPPIELAALALRPLDQAFLGDEQRRHLEAEMRSGLEELGLQYDLVLERSALKPIG